MSSAADRLRQKAGRLAPPSRQQVPESPAGEPVSVRSYPPVPPSVPKVSSTPEEATPQPAGAPVKPATRSSSSRAARVKPVRMTLDLAPALHAEFEDWTTKTSRQAGRGRVVRADVLRVLVRELLKDEELQARVTDALNTEG